MDVDAELVVRLRAGDEAAFTDLVRRYHPPLLRLAESTVGSRAVPADCPHCTEHLAQLRVTIETLGRAGPDDLSDDALDDLVTLYRRWVADWGQGLINRPRRWRA